MLTSQDRLLMQHLRRDARQSFPALSARTGIPISTVFDKMRRYEKEYVVKHTSLLNFAKIGYPITATILYAVDNGAKAKLREHLAESRYVNSAYMTTGDHNLIVEAIFRNMNEYEQFRKDISKNFRIRSSKVHFVTEWIRKENFLSSPD